MTKTSTEEAIEKAKKVLGEVKDLQGVDDGVFALTGIGYAILALTEVLKASLEKEKKA